MRANATKTELARLARPQSARTGRSFTPSAWLLLSCLAACAAPGLRSADAAPRGPTPAPGQKTSVPAPSQSSARAAQVIGTSSVQRVKLAWEAAIGGFGRAVAVERSADRVVAASGGPVRIFSLSSGKPMGELRGCQNLVRQGLALAGNKLLLICEDSLRLYDVTSLKSLPVLEIQPSKVTAAAVQWPLVALGHYDGVVRVYNLETRSKLEIPVPGPPIDVKSLALSPKGDKLAVAWIQGSIWWWHTGAPNDPAPLVRHESESDSISFSRDAALFAEEGKRAFTTVWNFGSEVAPRVELKNGEWIKRLLFTADAQWLVRAGSDGLELAEIAGPRRVVLDSHGQVEDAALDARGTALAALDRAGRLSVWVVK